MTRTPIATWCARTALALGLVYGMAGNAECNSCTVSLQPGVPSPQLVGERLVWTATATNCGEAPVYQFSIMKRPHGPERDAAWHHALEPFTMARDYSLDNTFEWAPMEEGTYAIRVRVKAGFDRVERTSTIAFDRVRSRVTADEAVLSPTLNPLVALYSAPPCKRGPIVVKFRPASEAGDAPWTHTNRLPCVRGASRNFVVAGMIANTTYEMVHVSRDEPQPRPLTFTTGAPPSTVNIPTFVVRQAPGSDSDSSRPLIYHNLAGRPAPNAVNLLATDLAGRISWYYDPLRSGLVAIGLPGSSPLRGGTVLIGGRDRHRTLGLNVLREIDLAGNPLRETNIDAINAQLAAIGRQPVYGFHHEMLLLPTGEIATLGWTLKTVDVSGTPTGYVGEMLMVLDRNLQVGWTWDAFDHLEPARGPILGELCTGAPCPLTGDVDWLHDNAIAWSAADGNFLISIRHQDWVIKIDYARGAGDGHIIWRLGSGGDFSVRSTDPSPWFSHQHYPHYLTRSTLAIFDNGNTRRDTDPAAHSRGQVWALDERARNATLMLNVDLDNYSDSLGTAEQLPNGNFFFTSGSQGLPPSQFGQSIEVLPDGTKAYVLEVPARDYRSFRMSSLYSGLHH